MKEVSQIIQGRIKLINCMSNQMSTLIDLICIMKTLRVKMKRIYQSKETKTHW